MYKKVCTTVCKMPFNFTNEQQFVGSTYIRTRVIHIHTYEHARTYVHTCSRNLCIHRKSMYVVAGMVVSLLCVKRNLAGIGTCFLYVNICMYLVCTCCLHRIPV